MEYMNYRKYPRKYKKREEKEQEKSINLNMAMATGIVAFSFFSGMVFCHLIKRRHH